MYSFAPLKNQKWGRIKTKKTNLDPKRFKKLRPYRLFERIQCCRSF